jgi:hypothetical protein
MNFKKLNNISGWITCAIACTVYILTAEATGSLWDCGEFISSADKLQLPHPPGAPLFVLLGRFFIILFGDNPANAAHSVNIMSAVASGFTILFLFWTITHFARKIAGLSVNDTLTTSQAWTIMGSGLVGALAYTFSDSFWYSAVEGEVYALSSFFTAIVIWAILKWETAVETQTESSIHPDRWIIFIFFMMGLSIGVHLLNLLCIPAIVMVYYLKKKDTFDYKKIRKGFIQFVLVGGVLAIIGAYFSQSAENAQLEKIAPNLRQYFGDDVEISDTTLVSLMLVGTLAAIGLLYLVEKIKKERKEYYGGMYIFFVLGCVLVGVVQIAVIQYSIKGAGFFDRVFVNNFNLPFFSGFIFFFIAVGAGVWYGLKKAKQKNWDLLRLGLYSIVFILMGYSTYFTTMIRSSADPAIDMYNVDNPNSLVGYLARDQYGDFPILYGQKFTSSPIQDMETGTKYQKIGNKYEVIGKDRKLIYMPKDKMVFPRMWDASDDQNHAYYYATYLGLGRVKDPQTGQEKWDDEDGKRPNFKDNISFFTGYQFYWMYMRYFLWNFAGKQNDFQGFFIGNVRDGNWKTGIGFVDKMMYGDQNNLPQTTIENKANNSLYGLPLILGIIGFIFHYKRKGSDALINFLLFFFTGVAINIYLNPAGFQPRERDYAYVGSFYAYAVWIGLGVMAIASWLQKKISGSMASILAVVLCVVAVPVVMAQQEWDDHDRSNKTIARDLARNYLESCPKDAILFTFGDNDTYPLWYAQEVENIRPDIRVINFSLLGIDWYINQMRYKVNESPAIDVIWNADQIAGRKRDYVRYQANPSYPDGKYYDLFEVMKDYVGKDDKDKIQITDNETGDFINTIPTKKLSIPVDKNTIANDKTIHSEDSVLTALNFEITKSTLYKNDLAVLNIIAANKWKRPICFTSNYGLEGIGLTNFLRRDGLTYRLVPSVNPQINADWMLDKLLNKFTSGNADKKGVYFDEENRRHLLSIRGAYAELAGFLATKNRKADARKVLDKVDALMLQENVPYGLISRGNMHNRTTIMLLDACYRAEHKSLAEKISKALHKELKEEMNYYNSLEGIKAENLMQEKSDLEQFSRSLDQMEQMFTSLNPTKTLSDTSGNK